MTTFSRPIPHALWTLLLSLLLTLPIASPALADSNDVDRVSGRDRYAVAASSALHGRTFPDAVDTVYIASGEVFSDALAAGPAAKDQAGVLLLTRKSSIPAPTQAALKKIRPRTIVIAGGTGTISSSVEKQLHGYASGPVIRVGGKDRYEVSAALSRGEAWELSPDIVFLASGETYADAVVAGGAAAHDARGAAVFLTRRDSLPPSVAAELKRARPFTIVVVGGPSAVSEKVARAASSYGPVNRIGGKDRYEVSANLAAHLNRESGGFVHTVTVTNGIAWADSLSASNLGNPVVLTRPAALPASVRTGLTKVKPNFATIVGGPASVSVKVEREMWHLTY